MARTYLLYLVLLFSQPLFAQNEPIKGLIAHYPFNGNAENVQGYMHGEVKGAEIQQGMRCGQDSYHFDGYKGYIDFGQDQRFNQFEKGLTASLWVYVEPKHKVGLSLLAGRWAFNKQEDQFGLFLGNKNTIVFSVGDGYELEEGIFGKNMLQNDTWYHLVGVWRPNGDMAVFINGEINKK